MVSSPRDLPIFQEGVVGEEAKRRVEDEGTEVDDESESFCVGGPLQMLDGASQRASPFEEAVGRAGLISETETAFDTARLPIC